MIAQWHDDADGRTTANELGSMRYLPAWDRRVPTRREAELAYLSRGRVNEDAAAMLMTGDYSIICTRLVAKDIVNHGAANTITAKQHAVRTFFLFLNAVGSMQRFFPGDGTIPEKMRTQLQMEEHCLTQFAMLRLTAGHGISGAPEMVSHVRTWYRVLFEMEFG